MRASRPTWHWYLSCAGGLVLRWQWRPVCSVSYDLPDGPVRRRFHDRMDRWFPSPPCAIQRHCLLMHASWLLGRALRDDARLNALADARAQGPFVQVTLNEL